MPMHNPPHPGESILDLCIGPSGETITSAAEHLGVSRKHLSAVINGRAGITADLAIRLAQAYGSSAGLWIRLQASYDAWHAEQSVSTRRIPTLGTMKAPSLAFAAPKGARVFARRTPSLPGAAGRRVTKKATAAKKRTRKSPTKPKR